MTIRQKHQRIESLEWEIMREEYQCESNPCRSKKKMADLRNELKKLNNELDQFYKDPMTAYCGF